LETTLRRRYSAQQPYPCDEMSFQVRSLMGSDGIGYSLGDMQPENYRIRRLAPGDSALAKRLFVTIAEVFDESARPSSDAHITALLASDRFWALAVTLGDEIVGGLTAHTLPMTRSASREVFIYDIAVIRDHQRRGVGGLLVTRLRELARDEGIDDIFVAADNEDTHALEFYRALGGTASAVTIFSFGRAHDKP
jgi:aminoglycoside 3-N-acetyltransferase I